LFLKAVILPTVYGLKGAHESHCSLGRLAAGLLDQGRTRRFRPLLAFSQLIPLALPIADRVRLGPALKHGPFFDGQRYTVSLSHVEPDAGCILAHRLRRFGYLRLFANLEIAGAVFAGFVLNDPVAAPHPRSSPLA